jgi:hypothetical protein
MENRSQQPRKGQCSEPQIVAFECASETDDDHKQAVVTHMHMQWNLQQQ